MLVDLSRNDLGRVSVGGSVEVDELFTVERYSHVMHLVSNVRGRLREDVGVPELFKALMPGGSVTGTPKIRATEIISSVEPIPRGAYTGSLGYLSLGGSMDFNLLIRSAFFPGGGPDVHLYSGSGIVQDSKPSREWRETREKAAVLVEALQGLKTRGYPWAPPRPCSAWHAPQVPATFPKSRVLLIDNYDSFTYNLVQYLSALGAEVTVVRNDGATLAELKRSRPTHVVISPGPGRPADSGLSIPVIRAFEGVPLLGVCLGHQAVAEAYGGTTIASLRPVHGKASPVKRVFPRLKTDLLKGLPPVFLAGRYHSLVVGEVPSSLVVTARSEGGEVMALQHRKHPTFGVQFHPESLITDHGMDILANFLALLPGTGWPR
jgi:anthranilate synthase/aminodeoxychorismate synthase-like glutamine amidotransferase